MITPQDALNEAQEALRKAKKSGDQVMVYISGGVPHSTRATKLIIEKWTQPGMSPVVGFYDGRCPVGDIAADIVYSMGGAL